MKQFVISSKPNSAGIVRLDGKDYNYLVNVRRMKTHQGLKVELDTLGVVDADILLINTEKHYLELHLNIEQKKTLTKTNNVPIILLQWLIKGQHMDLAIRQCTEAGVTAIFQVLGEFSVVRDENQNQTDRRRRIIREARQQSGSIVQTELVSAMPLCSVLQKLANHISGKKTIKIMLSEVDSIEHSLDKVLDKTVESVVLAIGCEGGISPSEKNLLVSNGFKEVHLKTNVLRAETAAIYAVAVTQAILRKH